MGLKPWIFHDDLGFWYFGHQVLCRKKGDLCSFSSFCVFKEKLSKVRTTTDTIVDPSTNSTIILTILLFTSLPRLFKSVLAETQLSRPHNIHKYSTNNSQLIVAELEFFWPSDCMKWQLHCIGTLFWTSQLVNIHCDTSECDRKSKTHVISRANSFLCSVLQY